ncbi:MAG: ABC transporter permease [Microbacterium sp.]
MTLTDAPPTSEPQWLATGRKSAPAIVRWTVALLAALAAFSVIIVFKGASPLEVFGDMWVSTFVRPRSLVEILNTMAPIALAALAVVVPARAGMSNVGGEGQVIVGAIAAAGVALATDQFLPGEAVLGLMVLAGMAGGAAWAAIAGLLRLMFQVNEAVSTLLLNFVALDLLLFLIYQPWRESSSGQPTSRELADVAKLPEISGLGVGIGIVIAVIAAVAVYFVLRFTRWGFKLSVVGGNAEAARRAGLHVPILILSALLVGGALAGLAGMIQFAGIEYKLRPGFALQIGYIGFLASWLARHRPLPVLFASFVFAALAVAGDSLQLDAQLPAATVSILTAFILIAVLGFTQKKGAAL